MGKTTSKDHDWLSQIGSTYKVIAQSVIANRLPAPVVGLDLTNEQGEVLVTAEMAWQHEKIAVVDDDHVNLSNWSLFTRAQLTENFSLLTNALSE
jgi:hypothetical protein